MDEALDSIAHDGSYRHELIGRVNLARSINQASGGAVIAPWDVDELDEMWIETFLGLAALPSRQKRQQAVNQKFEQFRRDNRYRQ